MLALFINHLVIEVVDRDFHLPTKKAKTENGELACNVGSTPASEVIVSVSCAVYNNNNKK